MLLIAVAWIYVVALMALTEPSFVAGIMTFLMYCVLPLGILIYITGGGRRRRKAAMIQENAAAQHASKEENSPD
ncbi:hypothetical protein GCM10027277_02300 [Pseudoduganella ginsengisoli]|uniref:Uncharacterized protein n=1 Tax=Pseudoduganella ginsengisoli TaxID=1462440 RepID=A0A6L6Q570_9BURK|nr:hypothetical protein [Pseudoduganella ginsengisoli]MTW04666.1 hypothetical protein [Pseudoduganella ginsengisoli]